MSQEQAENTLNASARVWVQNLDARVGFKKSAEYAPYGPLYMYFVATCVAKYAKFGGRLAPRPADLTRGSHTVKEMAARVLSSQYKSMFQPTHKMSAAAFFQKDEYDRMVDSDEEVRSAVCALLYACPGESELTRAIVN
jgi:hypothetical protein